MALQQKVGTNKGSTNSRSMTTTPTTDTSRKGRNHTMTAKVTMTSIRPS